jgi:hypothetical protein
VLTATSRRNDEISATAPKPQEAVFHQLNLQANAARRTATRSGTGRREPMRLSKNAADQD